MSELRTQFAVTFAFCKNCGFTESAQHLTRLANLKEELFEAVKASHDESNAMLPQVKGIQKCKTSNLVVIYSSAMVENADEKMIEIGARWEAVADDRDEDFDPDKGDFWRVRWSEKIDGKFLYVRHYGGNGSQMNESMAKSNAERLNEKKVTPQTI